MLSKVMVANRGEIAVRIFRTLAELGIASVGVYSEADRGSPHAARADEAYLLGPGPAAESYLSVERLVETALRAGADAIHPGYGFLAENAGFARAVEAAGLVWIGPPAEVIELMGHKTAARTAMQAAGVPIVPGTTEPVASAADVERIGEEIGYPLLIKAAAGGGGRGMKVVRGQPEVAAAFEAAGREGRAYFADPTVYVERFLENPKHVEVQILADGHGNVIHLGERDCTIQRRHQKLVEEAPSPAVDDALRARITGIAIEAGRAVGYRSAGTVEGLLDTDGSYYFMEMNTRIQVEHPVTEMVTGVDLIREQLLVAAGQPLSLTQDAVRISGHAIECRINAEDPARGFLPVPGRITQYREPGGPGVRVDSGVAEGFRVPALYDSLLAKVIVHDVDRERARHRMLRALGELRIGGVTTLVDFHRALLEHPCFVDHGACRDAVESGLLAEQAEELSANAGGLPLPHHRPAGDYPAFVEVDGRRVEIYVPHFEPPHRELARRRRQRLLAGQTATGTDTILSPMQGTIVAVHVSEGGEVEAHGPICVIEAMKMENEVHALHAGVVTELSVRVGEPVTAGGVICRVTPKED